LFFWKRNFLSCLTSNSSSGYFFPPCIFQVLLVEHDSEVVVDPLNIFEILPENPLQVWNTGTYFCICVYKIRKHVLIQCFNCRLQALKLQFLVVCIISKSIMCILSFNWKNRMHNTYHSLCSPPMPLNVTAFFPLSLSLNLKLFKI